MLLNLHFTYWVLLFTTLISSCFLFYAITAENVGYETNIRHASVATHASTPSTTEKLTSEQNVTTNAPEAGDKNTQKDDASFNEHSTEQVLPNYKKLKKNLSEQESTLETVDNNDVDIPTLPSLATETVLSSPSVVKTVEISETNDVIESSDSIIDQDVEISSDRVENKNLFNTIKKNENAIHSTNVKPIDNDLQVPDVNMQAGDIITQQRVQDSPADTLNDLPDITDIPTVTVTQLPLEALQQPRNTLDSVIIDDGGDRSKEERVNRTIEVMAGTKEDIPKDDQIVKINDSGGDDGDAPTPPSTGENQDVPLATNNIPTDTNNIISTTQSSMNASAEQQQQQQQQQEQNASSTTSDSQVNLTAAEEVPMPVFSEWAQKQMEAAEKQQALEQEQNVNNSAQRKNNTNGNGKPTALKIRAKNYASPDCGAKIIAASAYTSNSGAVLSSSKDEYMLSLCGNRIWFVVELCEAIQAQKIELANFELYSSSPQNFTVAVSKRFPTREWSNVGRFVAEDKRAVQNFDLHPHLFGKFVRVSINSHYSKEHFCTLSLFRVFGTSEFEAFETENHPNEDLDDFDEEYLFEQNTIKHAESNLFKSASDAVLSIVKKATEVLGKPANNQNQTFKIPSQSVVCRTPIYGLFSCAECPASLVEKVNTVLSCEFSQLNLLLSNKGIRNDLLNTRVCAKLYGIQTNPVWPIPKDCKNSFYVNILPNEYVGALCQLLARTEGLSHKSHNSLTDEEQMKQRKKAADLSSNLTIDKKFGEEDLKLLDHPEKKLIKPDITTLPVDPAKSPVKNTPVTEDSSRKPNPSDNQQLPRPLAPVTQSETTNLPSNLPDTNIFNVPADELSAETEVPVATVESSSSTENIEDTVASTPTPITTSTSVPVAANTESATPTPKSEEDSNSWDNIEHLLTTVPSNVAAGSTIGSVTYNQQKNSNGPQSESVFMRLSNRIKALERNMSLSGQYLEELSRRYKKQVEELQQTLTQQMQTVRALEEENRRHHELEQSYAVRNVQLQDELDNLILQVHACIVVIIFVGTFVFLVLMVAILFYRSLRRETKEVISLYDKEKKKKNDTLISRTRPHKNINRRKSFEDFSEHRQLLQGCNPDASNVTDSCSEKLRRPSEEVMLILKDCKNNGAVICQQQQTAYEKLEEEVGANLSCSLTARQRKISVCYGSNNNINQSNNQYSDGMPPQQPPKSQNKRRGEKHSWPNTAHAQLQAWSRLEELKAEERIGDSAGNLSVSLKRPAGLNGKSKKKKETLKRQQSSPAENSTQHNNHSVTEFKAAEFDQGLLLDEDDLDNFIPNTDLAYNEFMPDGPRGYQCINPNPNANKPASKKISNKQLDKNLKKSRHLSSPIFFKSPFTKSFKGKLSNSNKTNPAHESTSWEWYRLKKSTSSTASSSGGGGQMSNSIPPNSTNNEYLRASPNVSLDSSSLSEINFPTNSTENSFRILEEAILSSSESTAATTVSSNKKSSGGLSSSSNSNGSSSSNSSAQSKKKSRSFNKIFRKVF